MNFPHSNEDWATLATVVSAVAAILNLILIYLIIRYTIRQTGLIKVQADAANTQTEILIRDMNLRISRDIHIANYALIQIMQNVLYIQDQLFEDTLATKQQISACPRDWVNSASFLATNYPSTGSLPNQLTVDMMTLDEAVKDYLDLHPTMDRPKQARKIRDSLNVVTETTVKILSYLR